jgi:hypothetical protein
MMTENHQKAAPAARTTAGGGEEKTTEQETRLLAVVRGATRDLGALLEGTYPKPRPSR